MGTSIRSVRASSKKYTGITKADEMYQELISNGLDPKAAAKQAQNATGLSLITGRPMQSKGFGWQSKLVT